MLLFVPATLCSYEEAFLKIENFIGNIIKSICSKV